MLVVKLFQCRVRRRFRKPAPARVLNQKINFALQVWGDARDVERNAVAPASTDRAPEMDMLLVMIVTEEDIWSSTVGEVSCFRLRRSSLLSRATLSMTQPQGIRPGVTTTASLLSLDCFALSRGIDRLPEQ